ncbi:hypothetical protein L596_005390 [Steinernema carpocapsae]|uniref:Uncharacterized protein n=1 Tax=Steinernema carpocapsae TaxID=34508 RepID=A0A4U8V0B5_STECR|nr:hypothetical protein L596_005390 [Steinernema carpocapsae]
MTKTLFREIDLHRTHFVQLDVFNLFLSLFGLSRATSTLSSGHKKLNRLISLIRFLESLSANAFRNYKCALSPVRQVSWLQIREMSTEQPKS